MRKRLKPYEAIALGFEVKQDEPNGRLHRYTLTDAQVDQLSNLRKFGTTEFKEIKRTTNGKGELISKVERLSQKKLIDIPNNHEIIGVSTNVTTGQQWIKTGLNKVQDVAEIVKEIDFDEIVKKYIVAVQVTDQVAVQVTDQEEFDRLVYTDVHIGMTTNKDGYSLYGGKWDEGELNERLNIMLSHVKKNKKSNTLIIDELGDFMDGWDGETTRKGHKLPQNMDNQKAFDTGLKFKIALLDNLCNIYKKVICHNICEDNHAGAFGYVVNSAFKSISEAKHKNVNIVNLRKFISHYTIGKRCFILTHGKDSKSLKFGFKPKLDHKQVETIKNYIDFHKLSNYKIEFSKGDSHQKLFDESTTDAFDYYNYGALSPSSEWVQANFKAGKSFFEFFNFDNDNQKHHHPYVFEWKINREDENITY